MDYTALEQAVLRELQRQGVEFARVHIRANYPHETHFIVEDFKLEQIDPKYVEAVRVVNQIKGRSKARPLLEDQP